jgi:very-short-patch-repair endonuclease
MRSRRAPRQQAVQFMRFSPTRGEEWLWRELSGSKIGFAFRRQLVIGHHIVDFACTKIRLAVEVDGGSHVTNARHDACRDQMLSSLGWSVLRIPEDQIFENMAAVVATIVTRCRAAR